MPDSSTELKPAAPKVETVTVTVDGREVEVPKTMPDPVTGKPIPTTMIQACAMARVDVPHYCYHPKLPVAGDCRLCLLQDWLPPPRARPQPNIHAGRPPKKPQAPRPA